jgi:hypothetical protein
MNRFLHIYVANARQGPINLGVSVEPSVEVCSINHVQHAILTKKRAVNWVISNQLDTDIISMSWIISDYEAQNVKLLEKLGDAFSEAARKRIVSARVAIKGSQYPVLG